MMHCDTAIEAILEILDKPSLNSFHRKKSCWTLLMNLEMNIEVRAPTGINSWIF
jgi:hypothetical protein